MYSEAIARSVVQKERDLRKATHIERFLPNRTLMALDRILERIRVYGARNRLSSELWNTELQRTIHFAARSGCQMSVGALESMVVGLRPGFMFSSAILHGPRGIILQDADLALMRLHCNDAEDEENW